MPSLFRWFRRRPARAALATVLVLFAIGNVLAYKHAHAMTHFVEGGARWKGRPEEMNWWDKLGALFVGAKLGRPTGEGHPSRVGLPCEDHVLDGEAGRLEAWHIPHPSPKGTVLLFHGYATCKARLIPEAKAFHELGYSCFLLDFRACGGSAGDVTTIGYREADDVARAVAYVRDRWPGQRVLLFGQSMGSVAVLRAVGELGVRADALVLECPFDRLRTTVAMRFRAMGVPAFPGADLLVFWGGWQHGFNGFRHNATDYARGVGCPVLLLNGEQDPRVPLGQVEAIRARLNGKASAHVFEGLGHESYVARQREAWCEVVERFLTPPPPA